ncbi:MAG: hypothetical protein WBM98_15395 [Maribacter sp.]|uniref:hypothetical protein n=1 Tax=Maribacter sp. TaxID=1897614 RepID=UPI003C727BAE
MKRFFYAILLTWLGVCTMHSQEATTTNVKGRNQPSLRYNWSDIGTIPNVIGQKTAKNDVDSYLNLAETIDNSAAVGSLNYPKSASSSSKMPISEPKGIYKMRVFKIDSTQQFYLRMYNLQ